MALNERLKHITFVLFGVDIFKCFIKTNLNNLNQHLSVKCL